MNFNKGDVYRISKERMEKLFKLFGAQDSESLYVKLDEDYNPFEIDAESKAKLDKLRKQNLKLDLGNYKALKELNFKHEQIIELVLGKTTLDKIVYPTFSKEEKPQFDEDFNCTFCGHKHLSVGSHACLASICNCGIRG